MKNFIRILLFLAALVPAHARAQSALKPELVVQTGHTVIAYPLGFSPDGRMLATAGVTRNGKEKVTILNVGTEEMLKTFELQGPVVGSVAFSPDGKTLAARDLSRG